jgi:hypothetical protein
MTELLKSFPFGLLFRGVIPGGFFVLSFNVALHGWTCLKLGDAVGWLPLAMFVGVAMYTVHRSAIYPIIEFVLDTHDWRGDDNGRYNSCVISNKTVRRVMKLWSLPGDKVPERFYNHITTWADYIHMQYASTWCIILGAIAGCHISEEKCDPDPALILIGVLLAVSAVVSEIRLRTIIWAAIDHDFDQQNNVQPQAQAQQNAAQPGDVDDDGA